MPNVFFSLPILVGIIAGFIFPFKALELIYLNNSLLFLLMFFNGLMADWSQMYKWPAQRLRNTSIFLLFLFLLFPIVLINGAQYFISDQNYLLGFALSCIAPTAFVAPFFCKIRGGDSQAAVVNILISTLLFPLVSFIYIKYFLSVHHFLDINSIALLVFLITIVPLILSFLMSYLIPVIPKKIFPYQGLMNSLLLATLMFILCGSSFNKLRPSHFLEKDTLFALILLIFLDFGVYYLSQWMGSEDKREKETQAISISLRNLAIPASLLLSLQPKASIIPCMGLVVHCAFFYWLSRPKKS